MRLQVFVQSDAKYPISASWGERDGARGCWALPWALNSPKLNALPGLSGYLFILFLWFMVCL